MCVRIDLCDPKKSYHGTWYHYLVLLIYVYDDADDDDL